MLNSTTTCTYGTPLYWNNSQSSLLPLDADLKDGYSFQFSNATCTTIYANSTSTDISVYNGFSYGDIVNSLFLFLIATAIIYGFIWFSINKIKVKFRK